MAVSGSVCGALGRINSFVPISQIPACIQCEGEQKHIKCMYISLHNSYCEWLYHHISLLIILIGLYNSWRCVEENATEKISEIALSLVMCYVGVSLPVLKLQEFRIAASLSTTEHVLCDF